jgi:hypothetical protein
MQESMELPMTVPYKTAALALIPIPKTMPDRTALMNRFMPS